MDVNIATDVKGYSAPVVTGVEIADAKKPAVTPVEPSGQTGKSALDQKTAPQDQVNSGNRTNDGQGQVDPGAMKNVVDEVQKRMDDIGSKLSFSLREHGDSKEMVVQITDKDSGEIVKQFPAEEVLQIREKLNDLLGMLFDKKA